MAKLSEDTLKNGRYHIANQDLDSFDSWLDQNNIIIDRDIVRKTFSKCFSANDTEKALRLFDAVFPDIDPDEDMKRYKMFQTIMILAFVAVSQLSVEDSRL